MLHLLHFVPWTSLVHVSSSSKCVSPPMPFPGGYAWARSPPGPSNGLKSPCSVICIQKNDGDWQKGHFILTLMNNKNASTFCSKADHDISISLVQFLKLQWCHLAPDVKSVSYGFVHLCLLQVRSVVQNPVNKSRMTILCFYHIQFFNVQTQTWRSRLWFSIWALQESGYIQPHLELHSEPFPSPPRCCRPTFPSLPTWRTLAALESSGTWDQTLFLFPGDQLACHSTFEDISTKKSKNK